MSKDRNPQAEQMADASMLRTLSAQARAIWPQERPLLARYGLGPGATVLDVGCGIGEISWRVAEAYPDVSVVGVDIHEAHLEVARKASSHLNARAGAPRVRFEVGDAYALSGFEPGYDLVLCRHLLQAIPNPERVVSELVRVCRPGGWVHIVAEDYGQMLFHDDAIDLDHFWRTGPIAFGERTGTDMRSGRRVFSMLYALGLEAISVDYVTVDTQRVPRELFAAILEAWRDGYTAPLVRETVLSQADVDASWAALLRCVRGPSSYAVWHLPVICGRRPIV